MPDPNAAASLSGPVRRCRQRPRLPHAYSRDHLPGGRALQHESQGEVPLRGSPSSWDRLDRLWILDIILAFIPILGWLLCFCLSLGLFVIWLIVIIQAFQGKKFMIPVIGPLAEKQAGA